jgi:hypothetical protein
MADLVRVSFFFDEPPGPVSPLDPGGGHPTLELKTGQPLSGSVQVHAVEDLEFEELKLEFLWNTEGKGNRVTGAGGSVLLAPASHWRAGEEHRFPFSMNAPLGPVSYGGKILRVVWNLSATFDRAMLKTGIKESLPVRLIPDPESEGFDLGPRPQKRTELEAVKRGLKGLWVTFAIVLFLGGVLFGASQNWELEGAERFLLFGLLAGGFLMMLIGIWGRLGRGKLGEPTVNLSTTELGLGEAIRFSLALRPEQRTELRVLEAVLECEERVVHGHGQYQSHHRRVVFEKRLSLAEDLLIEPHRGLRRKGTLTLPEDGPPSFGAPHNQVVWWLRFRGDIVGWPDWKEPFLLTVRP